MNTTDKPNVVLLNRSLPRLSEILREVQPPDEIFGTDAAEVASMNSPSEQVPHQLPSGDESQTHFAHSQMPHSQMSQSQMTEPQASGPANAGPGTSSAGAAIPVRSMHIDDIAFGLQQTRQFSNEQDLEGLAQSIASQGVLQPILVRAISADDEREESFEVIAGERRLRAARLAGLSHIPAIVKDCTDQDALEVAIIENAQRYDLNPIEEALAYARLSGEFRLTQKEIAEAVGKNRATIANALRLLQLAPEVIEFLKSGELTAGHGRALLMLDDAKMQLKFARRSIESAHSVHALEKAVQRHLEADDDLEPEENAEQLRLDKQSEKIAESLGVEKVQLKVDSQGRRRVSMVFETEAAWKRFYSRVRSE